MLESLDRNMDEDHSRDVDMANAPTHTNNVESGFGTMNHTIHLTIASLYACFGATMCKQMHCLQSSTEIKEKAWIKKKRKLAHSGTRIGYGGQVVNDGKVDKWNWVSLFALPKDERHCLIRSVLKDYHRLCLEKPKLEQKTHKRRRTGGRW